MTVAPVLSMNMPFVSVRAKVDEATVEPAAMKAAPPLVHTELVAHVAANDGVLGYVKETVFEASAMTHLSDSAIPLLLKATVDPPETTPLAPSDTTPVLDTATAPALDTVIVDAGKVYTPLSGVVMVPPRQPYDVDTGSCSAPVAPSAVFAPVNDAVLPPASDTAVAPLKETAPSVGLQSAW
jgi:hypothetical protein